MSNKLGITRLLFDTTKLYETMYTDHKNGLMGLEDRIPEILDHIDLKALPIGVLLKGSELVKLI